MSHRHDWRVTPIKRLHFETLKPICPRCRYADGQHFPIAIKSAAKQKGNALQEGILVCTNAQCQSEYPVIDGIPIIVADVRSYISQNIMSIIGRNDLSAEMESLLGDCCGPQSAFDAQRQHLSTYTFDHYGDLDPQIRKDSPATPGSVIGLLQQGLAALSGDIKGPAIDIGCSVGRTTFELAQMSDAIVLGVDMNFGMLKTAASILNAKHLDYPQRKVGLVYERHGFPAVFARTENIDFWICDATCLPFGDEHFELATSLNVLDCLPSPYDHLKELSRILESAGHAIISSPYDWAQAATPVTAWIGGHSQRSENKGESSRLLRALLAGGGHPQALEELVPVHEVTDIPWRLRLHDRASMHYLVDLIVTRKK